MYKKHRLFIFGDSWAENLFRNPRFEVPFSTHPMPGIPYHMSDYFNFHYDVHNFGMGASSNTEIFYQLSNLPRYKKGDRVLIIWTHFIRFPMWDETGRILNYGDFNLPYEDKPGDPFQAPFNVYQALKGRLQNSILAEQTPHNEIICPKLQEELKFFTWITDMLSRWKPITLSWEPSVCKILNIPSIHVDSPIYNKEKITLLDEYNYPDVHLGGRGNYLLYKYILRLLDDHATPADQSYRVSELPQSDIIHSNDKEKIKVLH